MAQFLKQSIFLLLAVGLLAFVEADPARERESDHERKVTLTVKEKIESEGHGDGVLGEGGLFGGKLGGSGSGSGAAAKTRVPSSAFEGNKLVVNMNRGAGAGYAGGANGCQCGNPEFREFMRKFNLILRTYTSDNLVPELKNLAIKLIDYIVAYLAKEKPDQMGKVHDLLQGSADLTGRAVGGGGGGGRHKRESEDNYGEEI